MSLITLGQLKARLELPDSDTGLDACLADIIAGVSARLAGAEGANRPLETAARVEKHSPEPRQSVLYLDVWPINGNEDIAVTEALYGDFDNGTELDLGSDYFVDLEAGTLTRIGGYWLAGSNTVQIEYSAGWTACRDWVSGADYAKDEKVSFGGSVYIALDDVTESVVDPATDDTSFELVDDASPVPPQVTEACLAQCVADFNRRKDPEVISSGVQSSSVTRVEPGLLSWVALLMKGYRRQ